MTDHKTEQPTPSDSRENSERNQACGIADETAGHAGSAAHAGENAPAQDADGIAQTGEEDPLAEVSTDEPPAGAGEFAKQERKNAASGEPD